MPRRKKPPTEMTNEEALRKLFPQRVRDEVKKTALESQKKTTKKDSN